LTRLSILHLEDSLLDAELVVASLEMAGLDPVVTRVDTEKDYLAAIDGVGFDLILADYSLPSFDGFSALKLLRTQGKDTPFIFISGALGEELAIESLKRGATDYVLKHRLERLAPAIDRALRESGERADLRRAEEEKERLLDKLAAAYEREHRIAETLQRSFLKNIEPGQFAGLEVAPIYQAAWDEAQVGGDYYDCFKLQNGRLSLIVGDVSGKGLNAAERTAELKYTLRAYLREHDDAALAVQHLNDFLCEASNLDPPDSQFFVVLTLAVIDPSAGTADIVIAGAEPVIILRSNCQADEVKAGGLPLGIISGAKYDTVRAELGPGDVVLMATDGLTEARSQGDMLGLDGLKQLALKCMPAQSMQSLGNDLLIQAQEYSGGKLHDDACLLLARLHSELSS